VEDGGVGESFVPPLADVRPERVQLRLPPRGFGEQLIDAGRAGEPPHERQDPADRMQRLAGLEQFVDGCVAFPGARRQAAFPGGPVSRFARDGGPGRFLLVIRCFLLRCARRDGLAWCWLLQAGVVAGHGLGGVFCQVVPQVPPVRDLGRLRRAGGSAV
jgi:hypothetical protein